jgi:hypothetical protein
MKPDEMAQFLIKKHGLEHAYSYVQERIDDWGIEDNGMFGDLYWNMVQQLIPYDKTRTDRTPSSLYRENEGIDRE